MGWNIQRLFHHYKEECRGWAYGSGFLFLLMGLGWIFGGRQLPELSRYGILLGVLTICLGIAVFFVLKFKKDPELAAWLHVGAGIVTMVMAFGFMMPLIQDRFSVKTVAKTYVETYAKDASAGNAVLYIDKFLRPGFMLYTDIPGVEADTNSEKSLLDVKQDHREKYIIMREFMYNKMKENMGGEDWELLENKSGICIYKSR